MSSRARIGLRDVRALGPGQIIWDGVVTGFAARRQKGAVAYVVKYRTRAGRLRWYTIGRHGAPWTPDTARAKAQEVLGEVAKGNDPAAEKKIQRRVLTVSELCDRYLQDALAGRVLKRTGTGKKRSTLGVDRGRIERHIKPLLGAKPVPTVTSADIERFLHSVAEGRTRASIKTGRRGLARVQGGKTAANRSVGLLGGIFTYAVRQGFRADNPVRGIQRFADTKRERRLSSEEYAALGTALSRASRTGIWPPAVSAIRFLAITGWRRGEVLGLRWNEIDLDRRTAVLSDTKSGRSIRPLSRRACELVKSINSFRVEREQLVFPATKGPGIMSGFRRFWLRVAKLGGLPQAVTPHVLRHSYASLAGDLGYSESTIAALVGHQGRTTTSRYIHAADAVLLAAADAVADRTEQLMETSEAMTDENVVPVRRIA